MPLSFDHASSRKASRLGSRVDRLKTVPISALPGRSFMIDGEAIITKGDGFAVFDLRRARHGDRAVLCAFDLIELNGEDLRRSPIEYRKRMLAKLVRGPRPGIVLNEHCEGAPASSAARHRVEAARLAVSLRAFTPLAQD
jgi:ATP-dependent DNA ligase